MQLWAQPLTELDDAENSQREWSGEYFAKWLATPQSGTLGAIPLVVLTRAEGGYDDSQDVPAAQQENDRKGGQAKLALLPPTASRGSFRLGTIWSWRHPMPLRPRFAR